MRSPLTLWAIANQFTYLHFGGNLFELRPSLPLSTSTMFTPSQLLDLFASVASISSPIQDESLNHSISKLNTFLNSNQQQTLSSQTRVLDAALSLLNFNAPQLYNSTSGFTLKSVIEILTASVACKVVNVGNEKVLLVGSLMSGFDAYQVVDACVGLIMSLEKRGMVVEMRKIAYGVVRLVVSASCFSHMLPDNVVSFDTRLVCEKSKALVKLRRYIPNNTDEVLPFRLLVWYLDPLLLRCDVLKILEEALRRPFLLLNKAFRENEEWLSIITCLAISPLMFIEIRGLLHHWFLKTGLDMVQEVISEMVAVILDITSAPICWGLADDIGLKLPFSVAYFPFNPSLLRIFTGPLSSKGIENILSIVQKQVGVCSTRIDDKSPWAMAMNFSEWFYFSCALLFSRDFFGDHDPSEKNQGSIDEVPNTFAAKYIAWILSPIDQSHQLALSDFLSNVSQSWTLSRERDNIICKASYGYSKKSKRAKHLDEKDICSSSVISCLNKFQTTFLNLPKGTLHRPVLIHGQGGKLDVQQNNFLYRRVLLSILIGNHNNISYQECKLIMHYVIAGEILQKEPVNASPPHKKHDYRHVEDISCDMDSDEAVAGFHLAFQLTEYCEKICNSAVSVKSSRQVNISVEKYLLKCIKILLQKGFDKGSSTQLMDIHNRLIWWRQQDMESPVSCHELDNVINELYTCMNSL